ncbi:hypothetical protein BLNAU_6849 [Blattamonas nauphoetae]|uniref:Uncharacterized protein n=1 Tax=Blattamonas nauphoetae TaxID=2049346 RepID=A0ABQ9Y347_9EUKA|nr:hypothetical protein BLNAU_6849 [Blattamonas nauphoetae]
MFISTLTNTFHCSPGTVVDSSTTSSTLPQLRRLAAQSHPLEPSLANSTPHLQHCSAGTTILSYADTDCSSTCTSCTDQSGWCPVGSRVGNATIPSEPNGIISQVQDSHTLDMLQTVILATGFDGRISS